MINKHLKSIPNICVSVLVLIVTGITAYSNALHSPFFFDDFPNIVNNIYIQIDSFSIDSIRLLFTEGLLNNRPIAYLTFALNHYFHGFDLFGYHLVNIAIHICTSIVLYLFLILTLKILRIDEKTTLFIAFSSAILWLVHPVQIQSVTYIVQRMNSLSILFLMMSLVCYVKIRLVSCVRKQILYGLLLLVFWVLALGSKQIAIIFPVMILIYEAFIFKRKISWKLATSCLVIILISFSIFHILMGSNLFNSIINGYNGRDFSMYERLLTQNRVLLFYITLLFLPLPSRLNIQHDFSISVGFLSPATTLLSFIFLAFLFCVGIFYLRKDKFISFSIFWFFITLAIESTFIPLEIIFEHRLYLPSMAFCWLIPYLLIKNKVGIMKAWLFVLVYTFILLFLTIQRNETWATSVSLTEDTVRKSPNLARAHGSYGQALVQVGRNEEAIFHFKKAIELKPNYAQAYHGLGKAYMVDNKYQIAEGYYQKALTINPNYMAAYNSIGILYNNTKKYDLAVFHFDRATRLRPDFIYAWFNMGIAFEGLLKFEDAASCYQNALKYGSIAGVNAALFGVFIILEDCKSAEVELLTIKRLSELQDSYPNYEKKLRECKTSSSKKHN